MTRVFAFCGPKGCGKDTAAKAVIKRFDGVGGLSIKQIAFADPIKQFVMNTFGLKSIDEYDNFKRSDVVLDGHAIPGRTIVRDIGMLMRSYDVNQFTDYVRQQINAEPDCIWLVTDARFDNELLFLKGLDATMISIVGRKDLDDHISERGFPSHAFNYTLVNQHTVEQFEQHVGWLFNDFLVSKKPIFSYGLKETHETHSRT